MRNPVTISGLTFTAPEALGVVHPYAGVPLYNAFTADLRFELIKDKLSEKQLRRPNRSVPRRLLSNEELKRIAEANPPPANWLEGDEECPF